MLTARTSDPVAQAVTWIASHGIQVDRCTVHQPASHLRAIDPEGPDHPVLHLLEPGVSPPARLGELEDWVRLPAEPRELYLRADRLLARAARSGGALTVVDEDDVLRAGGKVVPLSAMDAQLMRLLLAEEGRIVVRERLEDELWGGPPPDRRTLDNRLRRLRSRLVDLPVRIHTVRGRGLLLERCAVG